MIKIFLLLIISLQINNQLEDTQKNITLSDNSIKTQEIKKDEKLRINFEKNGDKTYYITLLSLTKGVNINILNVEQQGIDALNNNNADLVTFKIAKNNTKDYDLEFTVSADTKIEVTCVAALNTYEYQKIEYNVDQEIKVEKNNFIIFLTDSDEEYEKFDMKFNFKDDIKGRTVHYGFLFLPTNSLEYIALGKHYEGLDNTKFDESAKEITVNNKFYEKGKDNLKKHFAFIFSIDAEDKKIDEYSFTINSEIINAFLIVSIVIALVFAVITFFLIRRKQSSESTTIEGGGENFYQNKSKDEKDEKEEKEEKDDKEEATEN